MTDFQEIELFPSDDELSNVPETPARFSPNTLDPPSRHISPVDRPGRRSLRSTSQHQKPRSRRPLSPPPSRSSRGSADPRHDSPRPPASSSSSSSSLPSSSAASPSVPPVKKWTVNALRQALSNAGIHFSRKSSKAQLHDLLMRSHQNTQRPASSMQTSTQATVRSIRFASNPRQIQPAAAAATASLSAAESGRVSVAAANISSAVSSGSFTAAPTVNVTFPPATVPPNALAMNPPPVSTHLRSQILAGADFDLSSLLPSVSISEPNRTLDFGPLTINLKTPNSKPNRILTMAEFCIAFGRYTEIICSVFPARRKELNDFLAIIAELSHTFGGTHFFTYYRLFSAKCSARVTQWNQCPYWGALDLELYNKVFLGCRNVSCVLCSSATHEPSSCPLFNPTPPSNTGTNPGTSQIVNSTSYVPQSRGDSKSRNFRFTSGRQVCNNFNQFGCTRQRCKYLHVCNFCGGAHARSVCPVYRSSANSNKEFRKYLSSPIIVSSLAQELANHPDKNFTQYLLKGLEEGFNPGLESLPTSSLICKNLQSANAEPEAVDTLIAKELESGFMIGPFDSPPFKLFRISPIGVATRKFSGKKRMIIDLSAPHNNTQPSINSLIPLEEFSLCYHNIDQAIHLIKNAGYGAWLAKVDITSAFKVMPIHPDFWHLFGIRWRGKFFFAVRLTFGCKSSPKIFDMLSEALCWILQNNHAVPYLVHLLDDFLTVSPSFFPPAAHLSTIQNVFSTLGVPLSPEKTQGPTTSLEFLGINLDSVKFQASLPKDKIDRIIAISSNLLEAPQCSKRDLLSLLGHLNYAMRIVPQGRPFISHLLSLASSIQELDNTISLTPSCLTDLKLWIMFLKQWNGLTFFYDDFLSQPCDLPLFTDAAPSVGFGGFYKTHWFASTWPPELSMSNQQTASSALFELYPIIIAAHLWGHEWSSKNIVMHCDNLATVHCINKGLSKSPKIMPLLRRLTWLSACNQFTFKAVHIPGHQNQIADALSRLLFQKFRALAPEADPNPTPVPPYSDLTFQ
ncbi:uncharacterized protein [Pseudorasbora parva]|uniref:uncharacterized protein n=1 Tax=Pseudorasbora parva TaxID=51549 RepID=UPI00351DFAF5